jgi:hypothetical protein
MIVTTALPFASLLKANCIWDARADLSKRTTLPRRLANVLPQGHVL